jgi:hypothetical protein
MKLTKPQIQFIDNYLVKNKVKFWDVRLELLDHIVSAVEDKIENDGVSFNEALLDAHRSFGNQLIKGSIAADEVWTKGLYQSNIGFEKFANKKQQQLSKGYNKQFLKLATSSFLNYKFYLELVVLTLIMLTIYSFSEKVAGFTSLGFIAIPYIYVVFNSVKSQFSLKSLKISMISQLMGTLIFIPICAINLFYFAKNEDGSNIYTYIILLFALTYIPVRIASKLFFDVYTKIRLNYKDMDLL